MGYDFRDWFSTQPDRAESMLDVDRLFAAKGMSRRNFLKVSGMAVALAALTSSCGKAGGAQKEHVEKYVYLEMPPPPAGDIEVGDRPCDLHEACPGEKEHHQEQRDLGA